MSSFLGGVAGNLGLFATGGGPDAQLVEDPLSTLLQLNPESALWGRGAVAEVVGRVAGIRDNLVLGAALGYGYSIAVEVCLELCAMSAVFPRQTVSAHTRVGPGFKSSFTSGIGLFGEVGRHTSIRIATRL